MPKKLVCSTSPTPMPTGTVKSNQLFQRMFLLLLFLSIFPSNSQNQLSSFYSLVSSLANKNNKTSSAKIKRSSSNPFWETRTTPTFPITSFWPSSRSSADLEREKESGNIGRAPTLTLNPSTALLEDVEKKVENLTFFQSLLRSIAATRVREELSEVSSFWANTARSVVAQKYSEVINLTRKVHEAQILSLQRAETAQLLNDAVSKANRVYHSSLARVRILETASQGAKHSVELITEALSLVQQVFLVRDKWAREERGRAFRLSTEYLRKVLEELKETLEFAQIAHSVVDEMR